MAAKRKRRRALPAPRPPGAAGDVPPWLFPALIVAAVAFVYFPVAGHGFLLWDDTVHVSENPFILDTGFFWTTPYQGIYMPLTYTIWSFTARLAGLTPAPFHIINAALHLGCGLLLFALLRRLLWAADAHVTVRRATLGAGLGALLFVLHPVQVEPVSWITSLKDLASGLFALASLLLHVRHVQRGAGRRDQVLSVAAFVAAMLCKPVTVSVILMIGIIGWRLLGRGAARLARDLAPYAVAAAPLLLLTARAQGKLTMLHESPLHLRPLLALDSASFYLHKLLLPLELLPAYGRNVQAVVESGQLWWTWIPAVLVLAGAILLRRIAPGLLTALLLFASGFALVSGVMPFAAQDNTTVYDRYLYLAMIGPALLVGLWIRRAPRVALTVAVAAALLLALGLKSGLQTRRWRDDVTLWSYTLERRPHSPVALVNLGFARNMQGSKSTALALYQRAVKAAPGDPHAHNNLGALLAEGGDLAGARQQFAAALAADPDNLEAHHNMGRALLKKRDFAGAERHLTRVLRRNPRHPEAVLDLGETYLSGGAVERCVTFMRGVTAWHPSPDAPLLLGVALARSGQVSAAIIAFRRALAMDPGNAMARANLDRALKDAKK